MAALSNQNYTVFNTQNVNDLKEILENFKNLFKYKIHILRERSDLV